MMNEMITTKVQLSFALSIYLFTSMFVTSLASADDIAAQQVFPTPDAAVSALVAADKADDMKGLSAILGPDSDQILSSGDPVADKNARDEFVRRYNEMHRLPHHRQGRVILFIAAGNAPVSNPKLN